MQFAKIGPDARIDEKREADHEANDHEAPKVGELGDRFERTERVRTLDVKRPANAVSDGFGECKIAEDRVGTCKQSSGPKRRARAIFSKDAAQHWADDKTDPKGRANEAKVGGFILRFGNIGHICGGCRLRCGRDPADDAANHQKPDCASHGHKHVVEGHDDKGDQQNGSAPEPIRDRANGGPKKELHHCKCGRQHPAPERRLPQIAALKALDQIGHHGHDEADPHAVQNDSQQDKDHG